MADPIAAPELTPELNQAVLDALKARIEEERLRQLAEAKGAATARGLGGSSYQAVREGMANRGASMSLADAYANMALEKAKLQREERLIKEGQTFQSSEALAARKFTAKQARLDRAFQAEQAALGRAWEGSQASRDRRASIIGAGLGAAGTGLGVAFGMCFGPDSPVDMADGSKKAIKDIILGDKTKGGEVVSVRYAIAPPKMFSYLGVVVTGIHAVNENGKWIRVQDSRLAEPLDNPTNAVFDLVTTSHRIWINGIEFADDFETDHFFEIYDRPSLNLLNKMEQAKAINGQE